MAQIELYCGSFKRVPVTRIFRLRLVCFALLILIFSQSANFSAVAYVELKPGQKLLEINKRLRAINKPAVKSIQSPDGDIIDCILRHRQLAFDGPLLRNHTIQKCPPIPSGIPDSSTGNRTLKHPLQLWHLTGVRCPKGTIPVRRTSLEDLKRFESAGLYGEKFYGFNNQSQIIEKPQQIVLSREYATVSTSGDRYYGSAVSLNVWNPRLSSPTENSIAQMWIFGDNRTDPGLNSIEVGSQVHPPLYGDFRTRFFVFWTRDMYQSTGCYNLQCPGFVQTDNRVCLGASIHPISTYDGTQHEELLFVWKDRRTANWWLVLETYGPIGYWPSNIFTRLASHASVVQWGGEVVYYAPRGRHTPIQMGSGHFARDRFRRASYMRNLRVLPPAYVFRTIDTWFSSVTAPDCYSLWVEEITTRKGLFYYGGPGRSRICL